MLLFVFGEFDANHPYEMDIGTIGASNVEEAIFQELDGDCFQMTPVTVRGNEYALIYVEEDPAYPRHNVNLPGWYFKNGWKEGDPVFGTVLLGGLSATDPSQVVGLTADDIITISMEVEQLTSAMDLLKREGKLPV